MAYITKRGNSYSVRYTYEDEHGKSCDKWESFPTKEEMCIRDRIFLCHVVGPPF